jgi:hypothetical protein
MKPRSGNYEKLMGSEISELPTCHVICRAGLAKIQCPIEVALGDTSL